MGYYLNIECGISSGNTGLYYAMIIKGRAFGGSISIHISSMDFIMEVTTESKANHNAMPPPCLFLSSLLRSNSLMSPS